MLSRDNHSLNNAILPISTTAIGYDIHLITGSLINIQHCNLKDYAKALHQNLTEYQKAQYTIKQVQEILGKVSPLSATNDNVDTEIICTSLYNLKFWRDEFYIIRNQYQDLKVKPTSFYKYYREMRQIKSAEEIFSELVKCQTRITNANVEAIQILLNNL